MINSVTLGSPWTDKHLPLCQECFSKITFFFLNTTGAVHPFSSEDKVLISPLLLRDSSEILSKRRGRREQQGKRGALLVSLLSSWATGSQVSQMFMSAESQARQNIKTHIKKGHRKLTFALPRGILRLSWEFSTGKLKLKAHKQLPTYQPYWKSMLIY